MDHSADPSLISAPNKHHQRIRAIIENVSSELQVIERGICCKYPVPVYVNILEALAIRDVDGVDCFVGLRWLEGLARDD